MSPFPVGFTIVCKTMLLGPGPKVILTRSRPRCARQFLSNGYSCSILKWLHLCHLFTPPKHCLYATEPSLDYSQQPTFPEQNPCSIIGVLVRDSRPQSSRLAPPSIEHLSYGAGRSGPSIFSQLRPCKWGDQWGRKPHLHGCTQLE